MQLIPIRKRFMYKNIERLDLSTGRVYEIEKNVHVPSVTTILSGTKDTKALDSWAARVGAEHAKKVSNDAALVGTHMHNVVERLLLNRDLPAPRTWFAVKGYWMGYKLIETFFPHVKEVWGAEIPLFYPEKYAGTSDCIGVYRDEESIIDFKQTNRMKQRAWIEDYFVQLAAYACAHNIVHGTEINQGVIMMVAQDGETKEFITCGREFQLYKDQWMRRVDLFLSQKKAPGDEPPEPKIIEGETQ